MKLEELIDFAYTLYPKGIREGDVDKYENTDEFKGLMNLIKLGREKLLVPWNKILLDLKEIYSMELQVDPLPNNPVAPCNAIQIYKDHQQLTPTAVFENKLIIYISVLVPYFAIASSRNIYDKGYTLNFKEHNFNFQQSHNLININHDLDNDVDAISQIINSNLPNHQRFPVEYAYYILQDIEFGFSKSSYDFNAPHQAFKMTLFNALFTCFI